MKKNINLNMGLRSLVIEQVLKLELVTSNLLRSILKITEKDCKTLGNESSALSFKAKIDLLYDLKEIESKEYSDLVKIMEIRNQFAHNALIDSFEALDSLKSNVNNYLEKRIPKEKKETSRENRLIKGFFYISNKAFNKLIHIQLEYKLGIEKEFKKYLSNLVIERLENIWKNALNIYKNSEVKTVPNLELNNNILKKFERFYDYLKIEIIKFNKTELEKMDLTKFDEIFKQKVKINMQRNDNES